MGKEGVAGLTANFTETDTGAVGPCPLSQMKVDMALTFIKDLAENEDTSWNTYNGMMEFTNCWEGGPEPVTEEAPSAKENLVQVELTNAASGKQKRLKLAADLTMAKIVEEYKPSGMDKDKLVVADSSTGTELGKELQLGSLESSTDAEGNAIIRLTLKEAEEW